MLRRRLSAEEHARIERLAREKRVSLGLEPQAAEDVEYEALRAEARESAKRSKRRKGMPAGRPPTVAVVAGGDSAFIVREHAGPFRIDARVYWTMEANRADVDLWVWEVFLSREGQSGAHYVSECEMGVERELAESYLRLIDAIVLLAARHPELA